MEKTEMPYWVRLVHNSKESNQEKIIEVMKAGYKFYESCVEYDGKVFNIAKVFLNGKVTLLIDGHALITIYEYSPTRSRIQFKMGSGADWCLEGERRKEYDQFVFDVCKALNIHSYPSLEDNTVSYINTIGLIDNGNHPFGLSGISI